MFILHVITGLGSGGAEGALYRLITTDSTNKHAVISLTDKGLYAEHMEKAGVSVYAVNASFNFHIGQSFIQLFNIIRQLAPDVVQTWMYHSDFLGGIAAKLAGVKSVIWGIRGPYNRKRTSFSTKVVVYFCMLLSRWLPRTIVSNSFFAKKAHVDIGYSVKKFKVIPNGYKHNSVVFNEHERMAFYKHHQIEVDTLVLGMVARFDPHKDYNNLFLALKKLQLQGFSFTCLLVGSGMDAENAELLSLLRKNELSNNVRLLGRLDSVPQLMSLLDLHILSSAAESFPNVLAEAMLMGTPCVTTDVGDSRIIVAETGWVVPAESPELLAHAIEKAIVEMKNRAAWKKRQQKCREHIEENYSLERMVSAYHDVWEGAVSG